jgi:hypothetical protein
MYSNNFVVPHDNFKITGMTKEFSKIAESGKKMTTVFCPDCGKFPFRITWSLAVVDLDLAGTTLYRYGDTFGGKHGLKLIHAGILDGLKELNEIRIDAQMFIENRADWVHAVDGAKQVEGMVKV